MGAHLVDGSTMRRGKIAAVLILAGLIALSVLVDRKVEAAERRADLEAHIERVCEPYNICPALVEAMIERESR